jgi:hypothetical protein
MVNKYTLGSVVFGIFLLAIMGIRSATNWLTQSDADTTQQESVLSANTNSIERDSAYRSASQSNSRLNDSGNQNNQITSQANDVQSDQDGSPLDEAGSYIQRQKRVEEDGAVTDTTVNVIPAANGSANNNVSAQSNTAVSPQPTRPVRSTPRPATPAPAVPALW